LDVHLRRFRQIAGNSPVGEIVPRLTRFFEEMSLDELLTLLDKLDSVAARKMPSAPAPESLPFDLASIERHAIAAALKTTNGDRGRAAELLGISRSTLYSKLPRRGRPSGRVR
jgi:DNA-binding NtrC family response regulator